MDLVEGATLIPKLPTSAPNVMPRGSAEANLRPPTPFVAIGGDTFAALLQELGSKETVSSLDFASRIQKAQKDAEPVAIPADKRVDPKMPKDLGSDVQTDVSLLLATQKMPRMEPIEVLNEVKGGEPIAIVIEASIPPTAAVQPIEGEEIR
ncbi:MAG: hypothetical protein RL145_238, partial [Pseudomonadota bacterium]